VKSLQEVIYFLQLQLHGIIKSSGMPNILLMKVKLFSDEVE
jgi:hypothetical protein